MTAERVTAFERLESLKRHAPRTWMEGGMWVDTAEVEALRAEVSRLEGINSGLVKDFNAMLQANARLEGELRAAKEENGRLRLGQDVTAALLQAAEDRLAEMEKALRDQEAVGFVLGAHSQGIRGVTHRFEGDGAATGCLQCKADVSRRAALSPEATEVPPAQEIPPMTLSETRHED